MNFLVDVHVLSELRKGRRANPRVRSWLRSVDDGALFLSVLVIGELRQGIEALRGREPVAAGRLAAWLDELVHSHADRILGIDASIADRWGRLNVSSLISVVDGLLAATALVHALTLVTRNVREIERTGVRHLDPFAHGP